MKKRLGQHFLFDKNILKKIVDFSGIGPDDTVVEIGPGRGTLTSLLSHRAKRVMAVEIDEKLVAGLKKSLFSKGNVEIVHADALKFPYDTVGERFQVVANIPYYISTPLIFRLLQFREKMASMTLLLQREIAQRVVAPPGGRDYGVLSISVQLFTKPELKLTVSRHAFSPPPRVDSAVVHFEVFTLPRYDVRDVDFLLKIVKTAFSQRRKTILNSLKSLNGVKEALESAHIDPRLRPERLSIRDFIRLADRLR